MLKHEPVVTAIRFFQKDAPHASIPYFASVVLTWETPHVVWMQMFNGKLERKDLRDLLQWLVDNEIRLVKAKRIEGHMLPCGEVNEDGVTSIDVQKLATRLGVDKSVTRELY